MALKKLVAGLAVSVFLCVGQVYAAEFEADMVADSASERNTSHVAVATSGNTVKMRTEMEKGISIVRTDKNIFWIIMPSNNMFMEYKIDRTKQHVPELGKRANAKLLKSETLDGHPCEVYEVKENNSTSQIWVAKDLDGFPIKTESKDGSVAYKNIKPGNLSSDLFEPPINYKKMVMPDMGDMKKGMPGKQAN